MKVEVAIMGSSSLIVLRPGSPVLFFIFFIENVVVDGHCLKCDYAPCN